MSSVFSIAEHVIDGQHIREFARATSSAQESVLKLAVKQYTPKDNLSPQSGDITIVAAHACGFSKELYEALWEDLYVELKKAGVRIKSIWIADCIWQGYSGQLNEDELGNDPSWMDYARDILHMVNTFRAEISVPVVAIGHSFGATALVNVSLMHPRLFSSMVLFDPVISLHMSTPSGLLGGLAAQSLYRRENWPSRSAAAAGFRRSPFYSAWDPRVLDAWVIHGLRDAPEQQPSTGDTSQTAVTLRTPKNQEMFTYLRPSWEAFSADGSTLVDRTLVPDLDQSLPPKYLKWPMYRPESGLTLGRLPWVRPPLLYVLGGASNESAPEIRAERLASTGTGPGGSGGVKEGKVREEVLEGRGHLIPMEVPGICAKIAAQWIDQCMPAIRTELKRFDDWKALDRETKTMVGDEWTKRIPKLQRTPKPTKI
ncbi:Abhydrolase domain-containing protein mpaH [Ceratocystis fimbriata CBS 114723]|uniref:Abhydrolase domain-containing protein mpaH n=1 Tax=Ceratocystis fimbriata CBS 114723 TaxID=1035309 RepID=A0A2C5X7N4_9PEZI|nr:Abhydrolase domain-containing protein mpaH [Ceratocystis fimbriata CBS 114723]